ncbi:MULTISPECIES: hypothetical protein [unclassified Mesorhizobium]|uniref:hypothetical protein n=1 Tax=unclassified Mesorhizobium TaxID=325217 RepID=UPI000FD4BA96|nr:MULTISPECIES: hypothetical protein [unclassified Mesorhizobium]RUU94656.1 hypothetical protein EOA79_30345 [Mesorhizobium sp. M1A.F.Ca.IN.020.03.2.1]RWG87160.1 MAG: hypothetical protein EOQ70_14160 [Mesorhizobium sp.]RWK18304.1 MAG: hypothetical protein EOR41_14335 [Mesorhizobium sp.]
MTDRFGKGDIVGYPYLWRWQDEQGREHGEKDRPVCLILSMRDDKDNTHVLLLPISSTPPYEGQTALEIPALELQRAKLSTFKRGWITVSECNYDILERSYHFDTRQKPRGKFSGIFLEEVRKAFAPFLAAGSARVDRTR